MDIQIISGKSLKLKIKKTTLVIDSRAGMPKTEADAILAISQGADASRVNDYRVLIDGVGEYEAGGLKISAYRVGSDLMFSFNLGGNNILLAKATSIANVPADRIQDYVISIIDADSEIPEKNVTSMESRVIIFYGEKAKEAAKTFGNENVKMGSKVSVSEDKLPEETEVYLLS